MLNLVFWLVFGLLVGWIAALVTDADEAYRRQLLGCSVAGSIIGGGLALRLHDNIGQSSYSPISIVGAILIAAVFTGLLHFLHEGHRTN
jgi:uncharacterized membrane protein YeaQ/YmgE (transglycosylase-associated protein family)